MHGVKVLGKLGEGSFGTVFNVEKNEKEYALKIIEGNMREGIKSLRELDIMGRFIHPNLMHANEILIEDNRTSILMDKAISDLNRAMYDPKLSFEKRVDILYQIVLGVKALHDSGYLHMDLKPLNVLLFPNNVAKLTDFGLSILTETIDGKRVKYYPNELMTVDHRSINILNGDRNYTAADDVWSLGIIFLSVLTNGKRLFEGFSSKDYTEKNVKNVYETMLGKNIDNTLNRFLKHNLEAKKIIKKMLEFDVNKRATILEIMSSPLFKNVNREVVSVTYKNPNINKTVCDIFSYKVFNKIFQMAIKLQMRIETFFLAVDIYQRSLAYNENSNEEESNIAYLASLSLYMAIKMVESYFADIYSLTELAGKHFKPEKLLLGEAVLINSWQGLVYRSNLFRASTTERRLLEGIELGRNCNIYPKLDLQLWREYSEEEEISEGRFQKYGFFQNLFPKSKYYAEMKDANHVEKFFEADKLKF